MNRRNWEPEPPQQGGAVQLAATHSDVEGLPTYQAPVPRRRPAKIRPVFYAGHQAAGKTFNVAPVLDGRRVAGSTRKDRLATFADNVRLLVSDDLRARPDPLGLRLEIGLPNDVPLLESNDLCTFLYPMVSRLTGATGRPFVSVWASKRHARTSSVEIFQARPGRDPGGAQQFQVRTTASMIAPAFRRQIRKQIAGARPLPAGGVALQLSFLVGPRRVWPNLWKVVIASLGPLLGHAVDGRELGGLAGCRVTDLGLHCVVDPAVGHDVVVAIRADTAVPRRITLAEPTGHRTTLVQRTSA